MRPRFLMPSLLLCFAAQSFAIVDATSTANTSAPTDGSPWANVGSVNGGGGEYLGNGWVLTAYHVGAGAINLDSGTFQMDGRTIRLTNPIGGSPTDILLYHLILTPNLAALPISAITPGTNSVLDMVGFGHIAGSAYNSGGYTGFYWGSSVKSYGTNKRLTPVGTQDDLGYGTVQVFQTDFAVSPQTSHEGQVTTGDSGGAVFFKSGSTWQLAGMIDALASYVYPQQASVYDDRSNIADLATYRSQINTLVATTAGGANWNGTSGSTWSTAGNWSSSPVPSASNNVHTATFNSAGNGNTTVSLVGGVTINTVLFDTANAAAYTIGSGAVGSQTLILENGGAVTTSNTVNNNELFNAALTLGTDTTVQTYTISNNSTQPNRLLTLAGNITGAASGGTAGIKTLAVVGTGNTAISGNIANGGATSLALTKSDSGTLTLSGTNTNTSGTTLGGGILNVNSDAALGAFTSSITINSGATLQAGGNVSTTTRTLTLGSGGGTLDTPSGRVITFGAGSTILGTTLTKIGAGTLTIAGSQTYAALATSGGATNINSAIGTGSSSVSVAGNGTTLKFGSVSQKLASLTIGAGAKVSFTSGTASFTDPDDTKALSFGGGPPAAGVVPEPGTTGLLLLGALSVLSSRRKRPS